MIPLRLKPEEVEMLDKICRSEGGSRNRSELLRLLIHREYGRRTRGRSTVAESAVSSEWRNGRPSEVDND